MKYGYISLIVMATAVACEAPTGSLEGDNAVQSSASTTCSAVYGQCGGSGWTGATCCASGSTCTYSNSYYSQCVPSSGGSSGGSGSSCPGVSQTAGEQITAATIALRLMQLVAPSMPTGWAGNYPLNQTQGFSVLASQRYRVQSSGTGIEFDPNDNLYSYVTPKMQAALMIPQMNDSTLAQFLSDGLKAAYANTDGKVFPSIRSIGALANFQPPGPTTVYVSDPTTNGTNSHKTVVSTTSKPCGVDIFNFNETVSNSWQYAPLLGDSISLWEGNVPAGFKGTNHVPSTPFNGPSGNPYLVVSVNGSQVNWSNPASFAAQYCFNFPNATCTGSIQIDPAPYALPGPQFDSTGNQLGTQANPFVIQGSLLADSSQQSMWATWTPTYGATAGIQQWGQFTRPYTWNGTTMYIYVKQY